MLFGCQDIALLNYSFVVYHDNREKIVFEGILKESHALSYMQEIFKLSECYICKTNGYRAKTISRYIKQQKMKYQVLQISFDYRTFQDIEKCIWNFTTSEIRTDKGILTIIGTQEVEQNGQVGIQMSVNGWLDLGEYCPSSSMSKSVNVRTVAVMRQPRNVWLWVYMFDDAGQPIAVFCGTDSFDENTGFAKYVNELKRIADGGVIDDVENFERDNFHEEFTPTAEEKVTDYILADGKKYNGWGCYYKEKFYPHGCGKKFFSDFYVYGNFKKGLLNGAAINSHNHYMYTMFFKNNRGNGWGLCINGGYLVEFGYYEDSKLKTDLTNFVQWYYEGKLRKSGRTDEEMLSMYTSKETKEVTNLLIGYAPKKVSESMILSCMGFRFRADGSVWVGTGNLSTMTGYYIHFRSDGCIDIGKFDDSYLEERMSLQELIDNYFGTQRINEDNPFGSFFRSSPKSTFQIERESERELYRDIEEPKVNFNYFTGNYEYNDDYSGDLPF